MMDRKILKQEAEETILKPYFTLPSRLDRFIAVKKYGTKYLKSSAEEHDKIITVTIYCKETINAMVKVVYDQKADAMYIRLRKAKYDISQEVSENVV